MKTSYVKINTCSTCASNSMGTRDSRSATCGECTQFSKFSPLVPVYSGWKVGDFAYSQGYDLYQFNILKYIDRHKRKNGKEDLLKALDYLQHYLKTVYGV
jgi:hypothetical protein